MFCFMFVLKKVWAMVEKSFIVQLYNFIFDQVI